MPHPVQLFVLVLLTLLCLSYLGVIGIMASLFRQGKAITRLPWRNAVWFYGLSFGGILLSTVSEYLRYFQFTPWHLPVSDICSVAALVLYVIAFFVIRKPWKAFVAANGGTTWAVLEASQRQIWQATLRRSKP